MLAQVSESIIVETIPQVGNEATSFKCSDQSIPSCSESEEILGKTSSKRKVSELLKCSVQKRTHTCTIQTELDEDVVAKHTRTQMVVEPKVRLQHQSLQADDAGVECRRNSNDTCATALSLAAATNKKVVTASQAAADTEAFIQENSLSDDDAEWLRTENQKVCARDDEGSAASAESVVVSESAGHVRLPFVLAAAEEARCQPILVSSIKIGRGAAPSSAPAPLASAVTAPNGDNDDDDLSDADLLDACIMMEASLARGGRIPDEEAPAGNLTGAFPSKTASKITLCKSFIHEKGGVDNPGTGEAIGSLQGFRSHSHGDIDEAFMEDMLTNIDDAFAAEQHFAEAALSPKFVTKASQVSIITNAAFEFRGRCSSSVADDGDDDDDLSDTDLLAACKELEIRSTLATSSTTIASSNFSHRSECSTIGASSTASEGPEAHVGRCISSALHDGDDDDDLSDSDLLTACKLVETGSRLATSSTSIGSSNFLHPSECSTIRASSTASEAPEAQVQVARVADSSKCFKCGNAGHWASSCPCLCGFRCEWMGRPCELGGM